MDHSAVSDFDVVAAEKLSILVHDWALNQWFARHIAKDEELPSDSVYSGVSTARLLKLPIEIVKPDTLKVNFFLRLLNLELERKIGF